ncbi:MAG: hypothetical protein ACHQK8_01080 [Bacteroidia bacterium]
MNRKTALFISTLFHPVFINLLALAFLFFFFPVLNYTMNDKLKIYYILFIFGTTGLLPAIVTWLIKLSGRIESLLLDTRAERTTPYLVTAAAYLFDYYLCNAIGSDKLILGFLLAGACTVVALLVINLFDKISIHGASFGALIGLGGASMNMAMIDIRIFLIVFFLMAGITLSARLFAEAHKPYQLFSGFFLGLVIMYLIL